MFRGDILIFVPEVCTDHHCTWAGNWDCPSALPTCCSYLVTLPSFFTKRTYLSIHSLFDFQQFLLHHFIDLLETNTVKSSSVFCSATSPQTIVQLNKCESKEQVVGTLEGGEVCARASSYSWMRIYPGNAHDECPLAIVSTPALWSLPPLLPAPLFWSALGHDPGENPICYLCSPKRL